MRNLLFIIFLSSYYSSSGQVRITKLFEGLPLSGQVQKNQIFKGGCGFLTSLIEDTLNPDEIEHVTVDTSVRTSILDEATGKEIEIKTKTDDFHISSHSPLPLFCNYEMKNDSLVVVTAIGGFSGFAIRNVLYKNNLSSYYTQWGTDVKEYKLRLVDERSYSITAAPKISQFILDKTPSKTINEMYGKVDLISPDYYDYSNNWFYKNGYIHKRIRLQYYFKCKIAKQHTIE
jgi:hypothetical protein